MITSVFDHLVEDDTILEGGKILSSLANYTGGDQRPPIPNLDSTTVLLLAYLSSISIN